MSHHTFTELIQVMRRELPVDDFNVDLGGGELVLETYADVRHMRDSEKFFADKLDAVSSYRVTIRWPDVEINQNDWIEWDGKRLDIASMKDPDNKGLLIELNCTSNETSLGGSRKI